jgi:hypothetical protein
MPNIVAKTFVPVEITQTQTKSRFGQISSRGRFLKRIGKWFGCISFLMYLSKSACYSRINSGIKVNEGLVGFELGFEHCKLTNEISLGEGNFSCKKSDTHLWYK